MIRSLYSGVAGMKNHQIRMDVIGNNIANVNTTGYKAGRANFQDTLYQTIKSASNNTNPAQAGLGIGLSSISSNMNSGGLKSTGRTLDLAINGSGFFKVTDDTTDYYTRDGIFYLTDDGYLVNSNGLKVKGNVGGNLNKVIQIDNITTKTVATINIQNDGTITGTYTDGSALTFVGGGTAQITLNIFNNQDGLKRANNNLFEEITASSGAAQEGTAGNPGYGTIESGYVEMSNVDLTDEFTDMITTQRGYQAGARIITVSDTMLEELINLKR